MNRKIQLAACAALACCMAFPAIGCGANANGGNTETVDEKKSYAGVHEISVTNADGYFVKDGVSRYTVLCPQNPSSVITTAAEELCSLLGAASGATVSTVREGETASGPFISLGETELLKSDFAEFSKEGLKDNGYVIQSKGEHVFIAGGSDVGTMNGVYDFLSYVIDFAVYAADEVVYREGDVPMKRFSVRDVPDIDYRVGDVTRRIDGDESYRTRMKYNCTDDVFMYAKGSLYHNDFVYFDPEVYKDKQYDDWFSEDKGIVNRLQLCYTAHGKDAEMNKMLDIASDIIVETAKESDAKTVTFMQQDRNTWCNCPACSESKKTYGANSAAVIRFLNRLSDVTREKMTAAGMGEREFNICFFAYQQTESAPVKKNEDGTYRPADDSVVCRDNVFVLYAPIYANYNESILSANNSGVAETLKAWNVICKRTYVWLYQTNFSYYLYPYNSLPTMADRYRYLASQGAEFIFDQNQWDQINKTAFHRLKAWMGAKLAWDVNADYETLLDEYFTGFFRDAAAPMRKLFDEITLHMEYLAANTDMEGGIYFHINQYKYWSKAMLDGWLKLVDEAQAAVEKYRETDEELYKKLSARIGIEGISVRYMQLDLYAGRYGAETLREMQKAFMNDCFKYGIDMVAEIKELTSVYELWGLM